MLLNFDAIKENPEFEPTKINCEFVNIYNSVTESNTCFFVVLNRLVCPISQLVIIILLYFSFIFNLYVLLS